MSMSLSLRQRQSLDSALTMKTGMDEVLASPDDAVHEHPVNNTEQ